MGNMKIGALIGGLLRSMRPQQWHKNAFVFAALIFDNKLFQSAPLIRTLIGFVILCLLSSVVYLFNDVADVEADRNHPTKRNRPIARGDVTPSIALAFAFVLGAVSLFVAFRLDVVFGAIALLYLALNLLYSFKLKHVVIVDVLIIAAGFVLRVAAGVPLVNAERFSPWLYVCMGLLALLLGFGKRRQELIELDGKASTRAILEQYTVPLLDQIINIVTGALIVTYSFYTFSAPQLPANHSMMLTIPFVLYGLFHYLYLVHVKGAGGDPSDLALTDRPLQITVLLWGIVSIIVLYVA
jgi:4-hydroxybenzoate polyprenyltransferase